MLKAFIIAVGTFLLFSFIHYSSKKKKPFKRAFLSMLVGLLTLTAVNLTSGFSGLYIPVTALSMTVATVGGAPGVALLALMSFF